MWTYAEVNKRTDLWIKIGLSMKTTHCSPQPAEANAAGNTPPPMKFKASLFTLSQEIPIPSKSFLITSSQPIWGWPAFRLGLDGWTKRTIFGYFSSLIRSVSWYSVHTYTLYVHIYNTCYVHVHITCMLYVHICILYI